MEKTTINDPSMKAFQEARINTMFFCKFLASLLLLLLLAFCCPKTMAQPSISLSPSPSPSPTPGSKPVQSVLPPQEVDAVNALLRLSRTSAPKRDVTFSQTDCHSLWFRNVITCYCNSTNCRVTAIELDDRKLTGKIPAEIGAFSQLTYLDLSGNRVSGPIPSTLVNLSQLSELYLDSNSFGGPLPLFLSELKSLQILDLSANRFFGSIPSSFVNLSQLSELYLAVNNFEGPLPLFISEMKSLQTLNLYNNWFNGSIRREFGILPSLKFLYMGNNLLSGSIPIEVANISSLMLLHLRGNKLSGQLPSHLGNLSNLHSIYLAINDISGALPTSFGKLEKMVLFDIQGNSINGTIPEYIANWQSLNYLVMMGNNFEGPLPTNMSTLTNLIYLAIDNLPGSPGGSLFPEISKNASYLRILTLKNCSLTDRIPDYIWRLPVLNYLDLSFNSLFGRIPEVVKQPFLKNIFLRQNKLNGLLPGWLLKLNQSHVDVSENLFFSGKISGTISPNTNLFECCSNISDTDQKWQKVHYYCTNKTLKYDRLYINCGGNQTAINGSLYEADTNPKGGSTFFLSNNSAWAYSSMGNLLESPSQYIAQETCNMSADDAGLYMTARVSRISLKYYGFCLKDDEYIARLHFAEIGWDTTDSVIKRKRVFDVEIQGKKVLRDFNIEEEAGGVHKPVTREFNISVNNSRLEIHLYWSGKGIRSYGPLISAISLSPVPKKQKKLSPVVISGIVGSVLLFVLMILGLCWKLGWLGGKRPNGVELFPGGVFNFQQIKAATSGFAPEKKIGYGGFGAVYRGKLPNGTEIAVKQLSRGSKQGVREFINEMGTIYALKHPNLVRLMGCCAEEHQLLLVYEYMENNSLAHALFDPGVREKLDWKKRVKICLDVARGLAYLHEECKLKLIHGDIKPTNILLDKDFNAKISDFGFARPDETKTTRKNARPDEGEATPVNAQVKGTRGYLAPECMKAKYSPKVDVYSFGILTLEIISGKPSATPSSKGPTMYLLDVAYDYLRQGNPLGLLDPRLGSEYSYNEANKIIHLAMQCVSHDPGQRPTMSEVVKVLEGKKKIDTILVPMPVEDLMRGKATVAFSQSTHSGSTSLEGASDSAMYFSTCQEIESNLSDDYD